MQHPLNHKSAHSGAENRLGLAVEQPSDIMRIVMPEESFTAGRERVNLYMISVTCQSTSKIAATWDMRLSTLSTLKLLWTALELFMESAGMTSTRRRWPSYSWSLYCSSCFVLLLYRRWQLIWLQYGRWPLICCVSRLLCGMVLYDGGWLCRLIVLKHPSTKCWASEFYENLLNRLS